MFKELLISFGVCLVIGAIMNGMSITANAPAPATNNTTGASTNSGSTGGSASESKEGGDAAATGAAVQSETPTTSDATFDDDVLKSEQPVLVTFSSTMCAPCEAMVPVLNQLGKDYEGRVKLYKVDIDQNTELRDKYEIRMLPTFVMFRDGQKVGKYSGQIPQKMLSGVIDKQLGIQ